MKQATVDPKQVDPKVVEHLESDIVPRGGDVEVIRAFLSLHEHRPGRADDLPPSPVTLGWFLRRHGLIGPRERMDAAGLKRVRDVLEALRARVHENTGEPRDPRAAAVLDRAARDAGLEVRFTGEAGPRLDSGKKGVEGAIARLLSLVFLAETEGTWKRLKECGAATCRSVFYDRSRNHSGRWCTMQSCGNRNKVRAWRERQERA
jgi:predicted RNA-binding Zn ribbon-like protein